MKIYVICELYVEYVLVTYNITNISINLGFYNSLERVKKQEGL